VVLECLCLLSAVGLSFELHEDGSADESIESCHGELRDGKVGQAASLFERVSSPPGSRCGLGEIDAEASRSVTGGKSPLNAQSSPRLCAA
jgi:hypothetical protein